MFTILEFGHSTHWSFGLGALSANAATPEVGTMQLPIPTKHAAPPKKSSATEKPSTTEKPGTTEKSPPAVEAKDGIRLSDDIATRSGISVETVGLHPVRQTLTVNGVTDYDQDRLAQLSVRVPGHVWRVEKREGEEIKKGECLAIVDSVEVGEAKTNFLQASVMLDLKASNLERLKRITNEVAERTLRVAEAEEREARLTLLSAQQKLINLGLPIKTEDCRRVTDEELASRIRVLGLPPSIVAGLDPQSTTANLIPLTAPFDGVVIRRSATIGEVVTPSTSQFVVADVNRMWILLDVRKGHAGMVRTGQQFEFLADGSTAPVVGHIDFVNTELDEETRTLRVRASVENPIVDSDSTSPGRRLMKAHTFGTGSIVIRETPKAVVVPSAAVQFEGRQSFVFVQVSGTFYRRDVQVGFAEEGRTEITEGLAAGDVIAVGGSHVLKAEWMTVAAQQ
ncbi:MAG: efflux RND transporter periplasmic adaptor subunit [Planctomycetia bacterium]|nr:efflux RND transporter periplasmic adaptor subunit [Planctomycetia bacterium]